MNISLHPGRKAVREDCPLEYSEILLAHYTVLGRKTFRIRSGLDSPKL